MNIRSVTHLWGDKSFDWEALDDAIHSITWICRKIGRIGVFSKEKYGTLRADVSFWNGSIQDLIYPGYCYNQFPKWLWYFDLDFITPFIQFLKFPIWLVHKYQHFIYGYAYNRAIKKHPHIKEEICVDADHPDLIKGGSEIHNQYWKQL